MNNLAYTGHSPDQLIAVIEVRDQRIAVLETELASARNLYAAQKERYERGQKAEDAARERIAALEAQVAELTAALNSAYNRCLQLVTDASNSGDNRPRAAIDAARKAGK